MLFMKRYTPDFYFSISKRRNASNKRPGVYLIFIQLLFSYIDITYKSMLLFIIIFWRYMQYLTLMTPYLALWAPWISHVLSNLRNPIYFVELIFWGERRRLFEVYYRWEFINFFSVYRINILIPLLSNFVNLQK